MAEVREKSTSWKSVSSSGDVKGSISLRLDSEVRQTIDAAADVLGKTRTEFMVEVAQSRAIDVLLDQRLFALDDERYDAFLHALDNPPEPGVKLQALVDRKPVWQK